jgi:hypothetical protein
MSCKIKYSRIVIKGVIKDFNANLLKRRVLNPKVSRLFNYYNVFKIYNWLQKQNSIDRRVTVLRETFILLLPEVKHFIRERKRKSTETPKVMVSEIGLAFVNLLLECLSGMLMLG